MKKFSEDIFLRKISDKAKNPVLCPFCGGNQFTSYPKYTNLPIQENFGRAEYGFYMPCGILLCKNCGHVDFFSLGALGYDFDDSESGDTNE